MSQFNKISKKIINSFTAISLINIAGVAVSFQGLSLIMPETAYAASSIASTFETAPQKIYKSRFNESENNINRILDWRNNSIQLSFDIPENQWVDHIELMLAADPSGSVSRQTPLHIKLNNGKIIPIETKGRAFDARIKLNTQYIRSEGNKITITFPKPSTATCMSKGHGAWDVDLKNSFLIVKSRKRKRDNHLRQIQQSLASTSFAPKSVSLLARGQDSLKLQALAAQGVALSSKNIPNFKLSKGRSDMEIIMARRNQLKGWATDPDIFEDNGPKLYVHEGQSLRIVITGDTEQEVMKMTQAFAKYKLPRVRRSKVSLGELILHDDYASDKKIATRQTELSNLGITAFDQGWAPHAQTIKFDLQDPSASTAKVKVDLSQSKFIANDSHLALSLNGHALGRTRLDKRRKSVVFDIPTDHLQGVDNQLTFTPKLKASAEVMPCQHNTLSPGLVIRSNSTLDITTTTPSPVTELSRLAATGGPFAAQEGLNTNVVLTGGSSTDLAASLKVLGQFAKASGTSWTQAQYMRLSQTTPTTSGKNVMLIGPNTYRVKAFLSGAPKSLLSALKGQAIDGYKTRSAHYDGGQVKKYASRLNQDRGHGYAARTTRNTRMRSSGLAAIYPSTANPGKLIGIITATPDRPFAQTSSQLIKSSHWNRLSGSVSRWNNNTVLMAQTARPVPGFVVPRGIKPVQQDFEFNLDGLSAVWAVAARGFNDIETNLATKWAEMRAPILEPAILEQTPIRTKAYKSIETSKRPTVTSAPEKSSVYGSSSPTFSRIFSDKAAPKRVETAQHTPAITSPKTIVLRGAVHPYNPSGSQQINWAHLKPKLLNPMNWGTISWADLALDDNIRAVNQRALKLRRHLKAKFENSQILHKPLTKPLVWMDQNISQPGLLLILALMCVFILMGLASPIARTGNHH